MDHFLIRGVGSLDMPLRVLDLMTLQGATVYRAVIDKEGDDNCVLVETCAQRPQLMVEKIRGMILVSSVKHVL
ncbi:MAG: hypothetical protein VX454_12465 [Pseudomonadota bacterium]|nr:hypothetical protein [Pseudomonadota bacterium]